ncbi:amyloid fiber anchoring/assembly protein TapA [Bacillus sp. 179-C3.3 HS]|uniref:amyloid fiber anchoring/assembly protein TapA n=1 Tax=Bacillus sp. 179-C3.3 HS TaxID=3232162 RepID=UPI0039A3C129
MKQSLFVLICAICLIFMSRMTTSTNASFNDVETANFEMKTCENFEQTDQNCQMKKWDKSHLKLTNQTNTKGTVCAPHTLSMTLRNVGRSITHSEWKWELHKLSSDQNPIQDGHILEKGSITTLLSKESMTVTTSMAKTNGVYAFKIYYPTGFNSSKHPFFWSKHMKLSQCKEKKT